MRTINPDLQEHVCFFNTIIKELKEDYPDLTDEKLMRILDGVEVLDTKKIAIEGFLWPYRIKRRDLLFKPLATCFKTIRSLKENTIEAICAVFSKVVDFLYVIGLCSFLISLFSPERTQIEMLFGPLACSFIYFMASRFFNLTYLITVVQKYYFEHENKNESLRET